MDKLWVYKKKSREDILKLSQEAGISTFLARIFLNRGVRDTDYIRRFLNSDLSDIHDPFLLNDMDRAVERIIRAVKNKEKIIIYGDYDVDGVTSTSILYQFLRDMNAVVHYFIPDRIEDGYGLSINSLDKVLKTGANLIITVDCGTSSVEEVEYIKKNDIDVVITDHHECQERLPEAYAIINPGRPDSTYPFKELAGVGVVYKLIHALALSLDLGDVHNNFLDLVALGTVADVVPLVGENRIIVKHGLHRIDNTTNIGLRKLIDNCCQKDKCITSWTIAYVIAPRVNAAGRMGDASRGVKLFTTSDNDEALDLAVQLSDENKLRQDSEGEIITQAINTIEADSGYKNEKVLVVPGNCWHQGIIGIVASKISERYYKPCIMISVEDGIGKGSGRSIHGFNLFDSLSHCSELLSKYGGHEQAAGLSLKSDNIPSFRKKINEYANAMMGEETLLPKLNIEIKIEKEDVSFSNIDDLEKLAPFGAGNPYPVLGYKAMCIRDIRTVGENKHLKLRLEDDGLNVDAIGFNMGGLFNGFNPSELVDIACAMEINTWNSIQRIQFNLKDIKHSNKK